MTGKERIKAAINHQVADRVPTGERETYSKEVYEGVLGHETVLPGGWNNRDALWEGRRDELIDAYKKQLVEFTVKTGVSTVIVRKVIGKNVEMPTRLPTGKWEDVCGNILEKENGRWKVVEWSDKPAPPPPPENEESEFEAIRYVVGKLAKTHFISISGVSSHPTVRFSKPAAVNPNSFAAIENQWYMQAFADPEGYAEKRLAPLLRDRKIAEANQALLKREGADDSAIGWDFGHNTAPFVSPEVFRRGIFPVLCKLVEYCKIDGFPCFLHSCGNNRLVMDQIVESGIDIYQSIQPQEEPAELKKLYGDKITLWGGVNCATLVRGTREQVRKETRRALETLSPGGGFVCATSHSVMPTTPYDNYMAMLDEIHNFDPASRT